MQISTPEEFFEKILPARFDPSKAKGIDAIISVKISGVNGGEWIVKIQNQKLIVEKGTHPSPTIAVCMSDTDYVNILNGQLNVEKAFFSGKIKFEGDLILALRLRKIGIL